MQARKTVQIRTKRVRVEFVALNVFVVSILRSVVLIGPDFFGGSVHLAQSRKVDIKLPEKENSNSDGARPVHQIISTMKWIRTSRLSLKDYLSLAQLNAMSPSRMPTCTKSSENSLTP